jgi:hypothetical protein
LAKAVHLRARSTAADEAGRGLRRHAARGLTVSVEPADMVLSGPVQDQVALWGLLDRILSSGLEVVEVRRLPITPDELG